VKSVSEEAEQRASCVVVGGGLAGMVAARRLRQLGATATVLEKGDVEGGLGNTVISGGIVHVAWLPPDAAVGAKRDRLLAETDGEIGPELADALAQMSSHVIPWLVGEGVQMRAKTAGPATRWTFWPFRSGDGRRLHPDLGPGQAMSALYANFRRSGGTIVLGARANSLERVSRGRWRLGYGTGEGPRSLLADCVLVADGGFQGNQEMLSRYVGPNAGLCLLRAATSGTGDGLRLLLGVGAGAVGLGRVYGHLVSATALESDELWPFPHLDELCLKGALVSRRGDLFPVTVDSPEGLVTRLARTEDPRGFAAIFDQGLWAEAAHQHTLGIPVANPGLVERGGHLCASETIAGLAAALGMAERRLARAVDAHNCEPGSVPIKTPPYRAVRVVPGITFTMGGARIGPDAGVQGPDGKAIPGLYAAGSTAGGVNGGPRGGYIGGLAAAATFGYIAGGSMAARVASPISRPGQGQQP
jgi:fumarate reductase flavoprotein subunit